MRVGALIQAVQEASEGDRVVPADRLDDHLPGGDLQCGDDGGGAVADVFELPPRQRWPGGLPGIFAVLGMDPGLLIDADHDGARRRAQVPVAHRGGLFPELLVSRRLSQPRTRCGRSSRSARIRPAWEAEMPVPASCPAMRPWVHTEVPSGVSDVAAATIRNLHRARTPRAGCCGAVSQGGYAAADEPAPPGPHRGHRAAQPGRDPRVRPVRGPAARSWRAAPAPAAPTPAARSPPISPCAATPRTPRPG